MKSLADKLAACCNLRTLVVVLGLALLFLPSPAALQWFDKAVFQLGVKLHNPPPPTLGVSIVELPETEVSFLLDDPGRAHKTWQLLNRVTASDKVAVGLVLPAGLGSDSPGAEALLQGLLERGEGDLPALAGEQRLQVERYLTVASGLRGFEQHPQVLFSRSALPPTFPVLELQPSSATELLAALPGRLRPRLTGSGQGFGVLGDVPLLSDHKQQVQAGFVLGLYARFAKAESITWHQHQSLQLNASHFPVSANADFIPYPFPGLTERLSLDEALDTRLGNNLILLGPAAAPEISGLANAIRSLDARTYYSSPYWFVGLEAALILLLMCYLVLLLPRLSYTAGVLATSLLLLILLVAQLGWQITQWQWLPLGLSVQLLLLGHLLISLWKRQKDSSLQLQAAAHGARYQLGLQLFRDGRSDDALLAIKECFSSDAVLSLMYDIAAQQERKRHYSEALKTYMAVVTRRKNFRDAQEKVEKLMAFSSGGAASLGSDSEIAKTLIISESSISKPVLGRYEIERELGRGAMGVVYLGRDPKIARKVAIKTLSYGQLDPAELEEFKQRFFREAEAAGRLNHPNIVTIYDVGEEHDLAFIAMDYVKGNALSAYVSEERLLPIADVLHLCAEVADALDYAHKNQIIHRDVKPANIMYEVEAERIKVTDFGVARIVDSSRTSTGDVLGSPLYMAPEQLKGGKVGPATDVYSLGVTLYQLLTGSLPFDGDNLAGLTYNIIHGKHPNIRELRPELPKGITRLINKALHKEADKRYPSAAAFAEALRRLSMEI